MVSVHAQHLKLHTSCQTHSRSSLSRKSSEADCTVLLTAAKAFDKCSMSLKRFEPATRALRVEPWRLLSAAARQGSSSAPTAQVWAHREHLGHSGSIISCVERALRNEAQVGNLLDTPCPNRLLFASLFVVPVEFYISLGCGKGIGLAAKFAPAIRASTANSSN